MAARCVLTDLLVESCGHCNGAEARAAREQAATVRPSGTGPGPWFTAQYEGTCTGCLEVIDPGDTIRASGEGGYLCEGCGSETAATG
jgi:hypothetical protein